MSMLLEALKKAALEKRDRSMSQSAIGQHGEAKLSLLPNSPAVPEATQPQRKDDELAEQPDQHELEQIEAYVEDWSEDIDLTQLDQQALSQDTGAEPETELELTDNKEQDRGALEIAEPADEVDEAYADLKSNELAPPAQPEIANENELSEEHVSDKTEPSIEQIQKVEEPLNPTVAEPSSQAEEDPASKEIEQVQAARLTHRHTKQAMAKLIEQGREREKIKQRRLALISILLIVLAISFAGLYWYFIDSSRNTAFVNVYSNTNNRLVSEESGDTGGEQAPEFTQPDISDAQTSQPVLERNNAGADLEPAATRTTSQKAEVNKAKGQSKNSAPKATAAPVKKASPKHSAAVKKAKASKVNIIRHDPQPNHVQSAYAFYIQGQYDEALAMYRLAYQDKPRNIDVLLGIAATSQKLGQQVNALAYYQKVLQQNSKNVIALAGMMSITAANADRPEIESQLLNLISENPSHSHLYFLLGNLYSSRTNWRGAVQNYRKAVDLDSTNADYQFNLAITYDRLGQTERALSHYQSALRFRKDEHSSFSKAAVERRIQALAAGTAGNAASGKKE